MLTLDTHGRNAQGLPRSKQSSYTYALKFDKSLVRRIVVSGFTTSSLVQYRAGRKFSYQTFPNAGTKKII